MNPQARRTSPTPAGARAAGSRRAAYDLMQEINGYYECMSLDAADDRQAKQLGWLWHRDHPGQTVACQEHDGRTSIVATYDG